MLGLKQTRWTAVLAITAVAASSSALITRGVSQREVRAVRQQAVRGCDAGWALCRFKAGAPVADLHGCRYVEQSGGNDPLLVTGDGTHVCGYAPNPTEDAADDEGACAQSWRVCFDLASATPGAGR